MDLPGDEAGNTQGLLKNASSTLGVSIHFNLEQLPCFTLWKNTDSLKQGYVTGLEPGTNFPNPRSYEDRQGPVVQLNPGGSREFIVRLAFHLNAASVLGAEHKISQYQTTRKPLIHSTVQAGWSIEAG